MLVRQILINALERIGIARNGVAPSDQMTKAKNILYSSLTKYSGDSVITAFQKVCCFGIEKDETVIGAFSPKKGKTIHYFETELPDANSFRPGVDYAWYEGKMYSVSKVTSIANEWIRSGIASCSDVVPDVVVTDMGRIVDVKIVKEGEYVKLDRTNLVDYYPGDDKKFVSNPDGSMRERLFTSARGQCRVVYTASMSHIELDSTIDLPEPYIELLELSVCVGCSRTESQLSRFSSELGQVENTIVCKNTGERIPMREVCR